jgi:hypothetical protein
LNDKDLSSPIVGNYIGEIRHGKDVGKKAHNCIWNPCPMCGTPIWVECRRGKPRSPLCRTCRFLTTAQISKYKRRKEIVTPPFVGEIRYGREVPGHKHKNGMIWYPCELCGEERWVTLRKGKPLSPRCTKCKAIGMVRPCSLETERACSKCNKTYPATKEYFVATKESRIGITRTCKACGRIESAKRASKRRSISKYRLHSNISGAINASLTEKKNGRRWESLVGYTLDNLVKHLEKQFTKGMHWDNYGLKGWTIDHIIPVSAFNYKTANDMDFHRCWTLSNLRPMWLPDNVRKSNKVDKPFQPSLALGIRERELTYVA